MPTSTAKHILKLIIDKWLNKGGFEISVNTVDNNSHEISITLKTNGEKDNIDKLCSELILDEEYREHRPRSIVHKKILK